MTGIRIDAGATTTRVTIDANLDTTSLEQLIRDLAGVRAAMTPQVPADKRDITPDTVVLENDNPSAMFNTLRGGGLRVWLRHPGFGWFVFNLAARDVEGLTGLLTQQVGDTSNSH